MPNAAPNIEVIKDAVQLACRAPSLHNSQPWRWVSDGGRLELFVDRRRVMPSADRWAREAIISCGAVLDHLACRDGRRRVDNRRGRLPIQRTATTWLRSASLRIDHSPMDTSSCRRDPVAPDRPATVGGAARLGIVRACSCAPWWTTASPTLM